MKKQWKHLVKIYHETIGRGVSTVKEISASRKIRDLEVGQHLANQVPVYISQLGDADPPTISSFYGHIADNEALNRFGSKTQTEYDYWAWRSCAIAVTQMVIKTAYPNLDISTMSLINEGLELNGYDIAEDLGWYHISLVKLANKYWINAYTKKFTPPSEIASLILGGNYVACVLKSQTGGHIVLAYGFSINQDHKLDGLLVHDPLNYHKDGNEVFIPINEFKKLSTRRIIVFAGQRSKQTSPNLFISTKGHA